MLALRGHSETSPWKASLVLHAPVRRSGFMWLLALPRSISESFQGIKEAIVPLLMLEP